MGKWKQKGKTGKRKKERKKASCARQPSRPAQQAASLLTRPNRYGSALTIRVMKIQHPGTRHVALSSMSRSKTSLPRSCMSLRPRSHVRPLPHAPELKTMSYKNPTSSSWFCPNLCRPSTSGCVVTNPPRLPLPKPPPAKFRQAPTTLSQATPTNAFITSRRTRQTSFVPPTLPQERESIETRALSPPRARRREGEHEPECPTLSIVFVGSMRACLTSMRAMSTWNRRECLHLNLPAVVVPEPSRLHQPTIIAITALDPP